MSKTVYATVTNAKGEDVRLGAILDSQGEMVSIWPVGKDFAFGWYKIERFTDSKLTAKTLKELFMPQTAL